MKHPACLFKTVLIPFITVMVILTMAVLASAGEPGRFSGRIDTGVGWIRTKSNIEPGDDNKRLTSLSTAAPSESEFVPFAAFEIGCRMSESAQLYLGIPFEGEPRPTLGMRLNTGHTGDFDISLFYHLPDEVWADPYITGVNRTETDIDRYGARLAWEVGGIELSYEAQWEDVDNDVIGNRLSDLKRDGLVHQVGLEYEIELGRGLEIVPGLSYTLADMDGKSTEYKGFSGGVQVRKTWPAFQFVLSAALGVNDHEKTHPVFNQTREDDMFETMAVVSWLKPLGYEQFSLSFGAGYEKVDSNINFYDQSQVITFITLGYRFGTGGGHGPDDDD